MEEEKQMTLYRFCKGFLYGYAAVAGLMLFDHASITIQVITAGAGCNVLWNIFAKWHNQ